MGFSVALLALAHVLAADSRCDTLPSCGTCLANSGCGWCASSTSCMSIASDGTVEGTCSDFQGSQCVGEPCSYYTTCNSCARVPFCMFNNANGRCEFLPASGEQPAAQYTAYGASCGQ
mmetsp:Transcript_28046/g.66771  ORF Transcript_28046/g.66771 Transcript_28046/m.66771 type:complete len:118 (-) Transcript_28046:124-477(-)